MPTCRKRRYRTEVDSQLALARIDGHVRTRGQSDDAPTRVYECPHCRGWHLTSQPRDDD